MYACGISIMAVFAVYGVYELLRACVRRIMRKCVRAKADVVIYVRGGENIEGTVRALVMKNPEAEIVIADDLKDEEQSAAARLLADGKRIYFGSVEKE